MTRWTDENGTEGEMMPDEPHGRWMCISSADHDLDIPLPVVRNLMEMGAEEERKDHIRTLDKMLEIVTSVMQKVAPLLTPEQRVKFGLDPTPQQKQRLRWVGGGPRFLRPGRRGLG